MNSSSKHIAVSIVISVLIIAGAMVYVGAGRDEGGEPAATNVVSVVDGRQIIDIAARGGYSPRKIAAKAGIPTVLRVTTKNTYDCSVALTIPKLDYKKFLGSTAVTDIPVSAEQATGTLRGLCSMGMYSFSVDFQ